MNSYFQMGVVLFSLTLCLGQTFAALQSSEHQVRVEFRWAEFSPGKGLKEATVLGWHEKIYLHKEVLISNRDIIEAVVAEDFWNREGSYVIDLTFTKRAAERMAKATTSLPDQGRILAILVDGKVIYAPRLHGMIYDKARIASDSLTREEAESIVQALNQKNHKLLR